MKKIILISVCMLLCMSLVACGGETVESNSRNKYKEKTEAELGRLTDDEKRILSNGGYFAKDRIYDSQLYDSEIEKVKRIRGAKVYLEEKYPNQAFHINLYETKGKKSSSPTGDIGDDTMWISESGENTEKWVKVRETESGYEYYDNWIIEAPVFGYGPDEGGKSDFTDAEKTVQESSYEEIKELDDIEMRVPSASSNKEYVRIETNTGMVDEVSYYYGKSFYVVRMKKTLSQEDISGTYYEWTYVSHFNMPNDVDDNALTSTEEMPTIYGNNEGQGLIIWYRDGISYSVFMPIDSDDEKLIKMYKLLKN